MLRGRDDVLAELLAGIRGGGTVVLAGGPGSGRTAVLSALAATEQDARMVAGLRTCAGVPLLICSWATGRDLGGHAPTEVAAVLAECLAGPLLVDDGDDADPATMDVLVELAGRVPMVVAVRATAGSGPGAALGARLAAAGAATGALGPLGPDDAEALAGELGAVDPPAVARRSGGVPGLLVPLAGGSAPPAHLLAATDDAVGRLSASARQDLAVAGLVPHGLPLDELSAGTELEEAHLLARENDQWVVRHGLAAERALSALDGEGRAPYRRAAGLARDAVRAVELLEAAGDQAAAVATARSAAAGEPDPGRRARLWGLVAAATGEAAAELEAATASVRAADGQAAARHAAAATVAAVAAGTNSTPGIEAWAALRSAQAARLAGDEATAEARLRAVGGPDHALEDEARVEGARLAVSTAWAPPAETKAPGPGSVLIAGLAAALAGSPDAPGALAESVAAAEVALDRDVELAGRAAHVVVLASRGEAETALGALGELERRVGETGAGSWMDAPARLGAAVAFHLWGDPRPLLDLGTAGGRLGPPLTAHLAVALADVGRTGEAAALVEAADWPDTPVAQGLRWWAAAEAAFSAGRLRTAVTAAERCAASAPPSFPAVAGAALVSARAAVESDAAPPPPDPSTPLPPGACTEHEALRLLAAGDADGAGTRFDQAASSWGRAHRRAELRCRWSAEDIRVRSGAVPQRHTAVEELRRLDRVATDLGLRPLVARVRRSLRTAGVRLAQDDVAGERRGPLSPREGEVLRLVGEGRSSSEIAAHLGVATSTVETQIKSAIRKLGATNRRHAAALAAEAERA